MNSEKPVSASSLLSRGQYIPRLIIWIPVFSIIITTFSVSSLFFISSHRFLRVETAELQESLIKESREILSSEVDEIFDYIDFQRSNAEEGLVKELKNRIDIAYSIIGSTYELNKNDKSNEEIISIIRETLRDVRFFDGRGYYFIHRHDLKSNDYTILQPNFPDLEGDHLLDYRDLDGKVVSECAYKLLEAEGEGFLTFNFYLNNKQKREKKLSYLKLFEPLNIFVGTGEYLYYFEEHLKEDVLQWFSQYRYGNNGYIFIFDKSGTLIMHPNEPELVGTNISSIEDSTGYKIGSRYLKAPEFPDGLFVKYFWDNPETGENVQKIGYAKYYREWNWNIATGLYVDSLNDLIQEKKESLTKRLRKVIYRAIIVTAILITIVFIGALFFAKKTANLFSRYDKYIRESSVKLEKLNLSLEEKVKEKTKELERKNKELEQLAITDSLSGIYNRRYFDFILKKEWYRHMRNRVSLGLIMCDIDFFKQFNDTYGHQKGDESIKILGGIIKKVCQRPIDIPVRYGGEEFALILPQTDRDGAFKIALQIQEELKKLKIEHSGSSVSPFLTVSAGISSIIPEKGEDYTKLIKLADSALYRAKANGRNRIEY